MSLCLSTPSTGEKKTTSTATIKYRNLLEKQQDEEEFRSECSHGSRKITRSQMKTVKMKIQKKNKRFVSLSSRAHKNSACRHAHCLVALCLTDAHVLHKYTTRHGVVGLSSVWTNNVDGNLHISLRIGREKEICQIPDTFQSTWKQRGSQRVCVYFGEE